MTPRAAELSPGLESLAGDISAAVATPKRVARRAASPARDDPAPPRGAVDHDRGDSSSEDEDWLDEGFCEIGADGKYVRVRARLSATALQIGSSGAESRRVPLRTVRAVNVQGRSLELAAGAEVLRLRFVSERKAEEWKRLIGAHEKSVIVAGPAREPKGVSALASALGSRGSSGST